MRNTKVDLSIIIPVYNKEKYLCRCLDSILCSENNNRIDYELVIINDGSTDKSESILEDYILKYPQTINLISQKNTGVSHARNVGLNHAKGHWVAFLDPDDYFSKNILNLVDCNSTADLQIFNASKCQKFKENLEFFIDDRIKWIESILYISKGRYFDDIPVVRYASVWGKIYRKSIIFENGITFPEQIKVGEDMLFNLVYFNYVKKVSISSRALYNYIVNDNSAMTKRKNIDEVSENNTRFNAELKRRLELLNIFNSNKYLYYDNVLINYVDEWLNYKYIDPKLGNIFEILRYVSNNLDMDFSKKLGKRISKYSGYKLRFLWYVSKIQRKLKMKCMNNTFNDGF